jgi:hypothetical protein
MERRIWVIENSGDDYQSWVNCFHINFTLSGRSQGAQYCFYTLYFPTLRDSSTSVWFI